MKKKNERVDFNLKCDNILKNVNMNVFKMSDEIEYVLY